MRRRVLARAVDLAGLPPGELVAEPVAAATYFATVLGHAVPPGAAVVVYDLGAGTFDVSVLRREPAGFNTLASDGLVDVGGLDLDALLVEHLRRTRAPHHEGAWRRLDAPGDADAQRAFRELWDGAREAKEALSRRASVPVPVPGIAEPQHVTREELEAAARQVLAQTVSVTVATMRTAGPVAGLFLVGGSTRVPLVASMLHRATGIAPTVIEQPELVVAEGALHASAAGPPAAPSALEAVPVASRLEAPPAPGAEAAVAPVAADVAAEEPPRRSGRHAVLAAAGCTLLVLVLLLAVRLWPEGRHNEARGTPAASGSTAPSPTAGPSASAAVVPPSVAVQVSSGGKTTSARPAGSATTTRPAGPVTVTATLVKTKLTFNGPCPPPQYGPIQLLVDFTVSGPTQIDYYWKSDPAWDPDFSPLTMTVSKAGTTRANGGFYGGWSHTPGSTVSHWVQLVVTKPVAYTSEQVTWSATCTTVTEP
jgi:cell division ATPase FtsA